MGQNPLSSGGSPIGNPMGFAGGTGGTDPNTYSDPGSYAPTGYDNTAPNQQTAVTNQAQAQDVTEPPPPPATTAPGGQQSGDNSGGGGGDDHAWLKNLGKMLYGSGAPTIAGAPEKVPYAANVEPNQPKGPGWFDPNAAPNDQPAPTGGTGTAVAAQPPANAPMGTPATATPSPPMPFPTETAAAAPPAGFPNQAAAPPDTVSPQSGSASGNKIPKTAPAAATPAETTPVSPPDIAGSARESGGGPGISDATTGGAGPQGTPGAGGKTAGGNPIADLLSGNIGQFLSDIFGQPGTPAGSSYAASQPSASQPSAAAAQPPETPPDQQSPQPSPYTTAGLPQGTPGQPSITPPGQPAAPEQPQTATAAAPGARPAPGSAAAALPPGTAIGNRRADEGHPEFPGSSPTNWYGTRPPDYFQRHGGRVGADLATVSTPFGQVTANKQVANDFVGLTNDLRAAGVPGISKFGSFNPRQKRYGSGYSSHAYGAAFDINDAAGKMNPQTQAWIDQHPQQWQDILRRHNFAQYMPKGDPNHLEWVGPGAGGNRSAAAARGPIWANALAGPGGTVSAGPSTRGDRNLNPGNIKMGPDARQFGATGVDDKGHAIFPTREAGIQAQASLLRRNYNGKTVPEMGRAYATDPGWAKGVMAAGGFDRHQRLNLNDPGTMQRLQRAIWKQEGTHVPEAAPAPGAATAARPPAASPEGTTPAASSKGTPLWQPVDTGPQASSTTFDKELEKRSFDRLNRHAGVLAHLIAQYSPLGRVGSAVRGAMSGFPYEGGTIAKDWSRGQRPYD